MCRIFAGEPPARHAYITRSIRIGGHATSVRLEAKFWDIVQEMAAVEGMSTPRFVSTLYEEALDLHGDVPNLASLLRCACVTYLTHVRAAPGAERAIQDVTAG